MATFSVKTSDHCGLIRRTTGSCDIAILMLCADSLLSPILLSQGIKFGPAEPWIQSMKEVNRFYKKKRLCPRKSLPEEWQWYTSGRRIEKNLLWNSESLSLRPQDFPVLSGSVSLKLTRSLKYDHVVMGGRGMGQNPSQGGKSYIGNQAGRKKEKGKVIRKLWVFF